MNPIVNIDGAHSSVWLIVIDEKIWGYVASADEVKSAFKYLAEKFIADIKGANSGWNAEAKQVTDVHMQIKCIQPGYVYNSEWVAHNFTAQQVKMYKEPNDNQTPILLPFPVEKDAAAVTEEIETKLQEIVLQTTAGEPAVETPVPAPAALPEVVPQSENDVLPPVVTQASPPTAKRTKKRSRHATPSPTLTEKVVSAVAKLEPLVEVVVDKAVTAAIEKAKPVVEKHVIEYVPAVQTPIEVQLNKPTHVPVSPPRSLTNSWERKNHSISHVTKYPQNRSVIKKK